MIAPTYGEVKEFGVSIVEAKLLRYSVLFFVSLYCVPLQKPPFYLSKSLYLLRLLATMALQAI